jgi:hypothetical protein
MLFSLGRRRIKFGKVPLKQKQNSYLCLQRLQRTSNVVNGQKTLDVINERS